jgi:TonB family protein
VHKREWKKVLSIALAGVAIAGCDRRDRARGSSTSLREAEAPAAMGTATNVYRFVGVEQALGEARRAVQEERWADAVAATDELLRQQPQNSEAQSLNHQAKLELPNLAHYQTFTRAAQANEVAAALKAYHQINEGSVYREKGRVPLEKLRASYLDGEEASARALTREGRCDDARRLARVGAEWFPDARGRLDDVVAGCKPAPTPAPVTVAKVTTPPPTSTRPAVIETAQPATRALEPATRTPPSAVVATLPATTAPHPTTPTVQRTAVASTAPAAPTPAPAAPTPAPAAPTPTPAPAAVAAQTVPMSSIENQMIAGDKEIHLPPAAIQALSQKGQHQTILMAKLCVNTSGAVSSVDVTKSSGSADADRSVADKIHEWRFKPYLLNGQAVPVCTVKMFRYIIE